MNHPPDVPDVPDLPDMDTSTTSTTEPNNNHSSLGNDHIASPSTPQSSLITTTVASAERCEPNERYCAEQIASSASCETCETCKVCKVKDELIELKEVQIRTLRNKLKKAQNKVYYLETIKRKLDTAFSELKKKSVFNEAICTAMEVCNVCKLLQC